MKPILLRMTAFGPYINTEEIDFQEFQQGLYLITGDTGAGKTTIFDAIMIALFGETSGKPGEGKPRTFEMMHSDHVGKDVNSEVYLKFEHGGKEYVVERSLRYTKNRKTREYNGSSASVKFYEPEKDVSVKWTEANARIVEILGLNAEQFRKIVMLAQGEFKKFLQANSDEKNKILGELFDNQPYVYYQNLLDKTKDRLQKARSQAINAISNAMDSFMMPPGLSQEETEVFMAGHSGLLMALDQLVDQDVLETDALQLKSDTLSKERDRLLSSVNKAKQDLSILADHSKQEKHLAELKLQKPGMDALRSLIDQVKKITIFILPAQDQYRGASKQVEEQKKAIENVQKSIEIKAAEEKVAQKNVEEDIPKKKEVENLQLAIKRIDDSLPQYQQYEKTQNEQENARNTLSAIQKEIETLLDEIQNAQNEKKTLEESLENLGDVEAKRIQAEGKRQEAGRKLDQLCNEEAGILCQVDAMKDKEKECLEAENLLVTYKNAAKASFQAYVAKNQRFLAGQAAILAQELGEKIAQEGEALCPVCKSHFIKGQELSFARMPSDMPTEQQVQDAQSLYEADRQRHEKQKNTLTGLETDLAHRKKVLMRDWKQMTGEVILWADMTEELLADYQKSYEGAYKAAQKEENQCIRDCSSARTFEKKRKKLNADLEEKEEKRKQKDENRQAMEKSVTEYQAILDTMKPQLIYASEEDALSEKQKLEDKRNSLQTQIDAHLKSLEEARETLSTLQGSGQSLKKQLPAMEENATSAMEELDQQIKECGFASKEDVNRVLSQVQQQMQGVRFSRSSLNQWSIEKDTLLANYDMDLDHTRKALQDLKDKIKDMPYRQNIALEDHIKELEIQLEEKTLVWNQLTEKKENFAILSNNHVNTRDKVLANQKELARSDGAYDRIRKLADLAMGSNAVGGKLSFDRFVMGAIFREILDMANVRLDVMTGGKYELKHSLSAVRMTDKAGLEINVLDHTTGKERPAASLSGGESFMVSLALALGLSDVVQNRAGGTRLDSLFIDEGFGTLDDSVLDKSVEVLKQLTLGNRLVGIISHVEKLEGSIPQQIRVNSADKGSCITIRT